MAAVVNAHECLALGCGSEGRGFESPSVTPSFAGKMQ